MSAITRIWKIVSTILIAIIVIIAIGLVGVRLIGLQPFAILSGSMEPVYHVGSVVYVKKVDYHNLIEGDPITFMLDENTIVTHRIVEVVSDEKNPNVIRFRTKGDANDTADAGLVHYKNVIGMATFTIPYLGYLAHFIQKPPGKYYAIAVCFLILLLAFVPDLFEEENEEGTKKELGNL